MPAWLSRLLDRSDAAPYARVYTNIPPAFRRAFGDH
jgi:hypothetical protein